MGSNQGSASTSLFESEMRSQVENAEAAVLDAIAEGDPILVDMARSHLDGLIGLAHRNGLEIVPNVPAETTVVVEAITLPEAEAAAS